MNRITKMFTIQTGTEVVADINIFRYLWCQFRMRFSQKARDRLEEAQAMHDYVLELLTREIAKSNLKEDSAKLQLAYDESVDDTTIIEGRGIEVVEYDDGAAFDEIREQVQFDIVPEYNPKY